MISEREELLALEAKLDAARAKLDKAERAWREAQATYEAETRELHGEYENLLCNADSWPEAERQAPTNSELNHGEAE